MPTYPERFTDFMRQRGRRTRLWPDGRLCANRSGWGDVAGIGTFFAVVLAICTWVVLAEGEPWWILVVVGVPALFAAVAALRIALGVNPYLEIRDDAIVGCIDRGDRRQVIPLAAWRIRGIRAIDNSTSASVEFWADHRDADGRRWKLFIGEVDADRESLDAAQAALVGYGFARPVIVDGRPVSTS